MEKDVTKLADKSSKNNSISAGFALNKLKALPALNISRLVRMAFPALCAVCDTHIYDDGICANCWPKLEPMPEPACRKCARILHHQTITGCCEACLLNPPIITQIIAAYRYNVISKSLILKFKYADRLELTTIFSTLLSPAFNQLCNPDTLVIPIPLHPARYRKRMFNQSSEIARSLCRTHECTPLYQPSLLERVVNTEQLGRMRRSQRAKTLKGAFTINHQKQNLLIGKPCLLIDDVITTGSTISEAAKKLLSAGALQVNALCFASAR